MLLPCESTHARALDARMLDARRVVLTLAFLSRAHDPRTAPTEANSATPATRTRIALEHHVRFLELRRNQPCS